MKIGVVGNGMIVNMFLHNAALVDNAEIISICVRPHSLKKGQELAAEYNIPLVETDYFNFLKNPEIEAVYIGISNLAHYEYAKNALEAGKHVILEKPFTVTNAEAKTLASIAMENNLFIWEAFIIPYLPTYSTLKDSISKIGKIKIVHCNYSKVSSRYSQYLNGTILPAFDLSLAGGALYDLNIYNIHLTVSFFGKPKAVHYYPNKGFNGVDTSGTAILEYEDFHAVCCAAKDSSSPSGVIIQGEKGTLIAGGSASTLSTITLSAENEEILLASYDGKNKLSYELTEFIRQFENIDFKSCYKMLQHSLTVTEVVDALLSK